MNLTEVLEKCTYIAHHPDELLHQYKKDGKKVVGCFPIYIPKPLVDAAGAIPMGLWGGEINPTYAGKYNPVFTCSIMRSCLEFGMTGVYKGVDAAIMPILCDTFRGMNSSWRAAVKDIPLVAFVPPENRKDPAAHDYMADEYRTVRERLAKILKVEITDASINASIKKYNKQNALMRKFVEIAVKHLDVITPVVRHDVMKAAQFISVDEHIALMEQLLTELEKMPAFIWKGKRAYLTGITAEPDALLELLAKNKVAVVGDDVAQESRQYRSDYGTEQDPFDALADQWMHMTACSTVHEEPVDIRGKFITAEAKKYGADAVIVCLMRFCDVEEYDYPEIDEACEKAGLYCLCLEIDQSTQDIGQTQTKVQSYAEM